MRHVVVVGASLAGLRTVESLRTAGFEGAITVVGAEPHLPYDRPPLSKRLLAGEWEPDRIALRKPDDMGSLDVAWRLGAPAARLDLERRAVVLADGDEVAFDGAVIATGSHARRIPGQEANPDTVVLRSLDDAIDLRARLVGGGRRVVVIGAGFIGLEVAATARKLGNDVLVIEAGPAPLMRGLGASMGHAVAAVHGDHGVEVRCGVSVEGFIPGAVLIDGGWHEPADVVVVGIGVTPSTDWLVDSGLTVRDGVVCAPDLSTGAPLVYAAGDVARWHNPLFDEEMRVEHWTNAAEQGAAAAANLLAEDTGLPTTPYAPVPFFWSEQYDRRIQFLGRAHADHQVEVVLGSVDARQFVALYGDGERLRGVLGMNMPRQVMPFRNLLLDRADWSTGLAFAASLAT
jgi:NADPH-dependent 2,4-dienoyl-CoA reductase/sulfur reductase-like enzyme